MMFGLIVHASYSLPQCQAVKLNFFCTLFKPRVQSKAVTVVNVLLKLVTHTEDF